MTSLCNSPGGSRTKVLETRKSIEFPLNETNLQHRYNKSMSHFPQYSKTELANIIREYESKLFSRNEEKEIQVTDQDFIRSYLGEDRL